MKTYWVTFRIQQTGDHAARYQELIDVLNEVSGDTWWIEPTSFVMFRSGDTIDTISAWLKASINPSKDIILVGMADFKSARAIGNLEHFATLQGLMPFVKRI